MKAPLSYVPALPAAAGLIAGIVLYKCSLALPGAVLAALAFLALYVVKRHYLAFYALMTLIGVILAYTRWPAELPSSCLGEQTFIGRVVSESQPANTTNYTIKIREISGEPVQDAMCRLTVFSVADPIAAGSIVKVHGEISLLEPQTDVPHQADYTSFLRAQGICYGCAVGPEAIDVVELPGWFDANVNKMRDAIFNSIVNSPIDASTASFLLAVIIGNREFLPNDTLTSYRSLGIAHIMALSGLHVGVLASMLVLLLFPLKVFDRGIVVRSAIVIIVIWLYAIVCGLGASILRAAVMLTVFTLVRFIQRGYAAYNSLLLSVVMILLYRPTDLFTPGFQLSVAAVASILVFSPVVPVTLKHRPLLYYGANMVVVPIAAMIGTGMISAYYFHSFPLMFLVANIAAGVIFPWIFTGGVMLVLFGMLGLHFGMLGLAVDTLYGWLNAVVDFLCGVGAVSVEGLYFSPWAILPYAIAILLLGFTVAYKRRILLILSCLFFVLTVIAVTLTQEEITAAELYVPRTRGVTNIIFRSGSNAYIYTTSTEADIDANLQSANRLYQGFLSSRGCGTELKLVTDTLNTQHIRVKSPYICFADKVIYVACNDTLWVNPSLKIDYAIVCKGYNRSLEYLDTVLRPDSIIISTDVNKRKIKKFYSEHVSKARSLGSGALSFSW